MASASRIPRYLSPQEILQLEILSDFSEYESDDVEEEDKDEDDTDCKRPQKCENDDSGESIEVLEEESAVQNIQPAGISKAYGPSYVSLTYNSLISSVSRYVDRARLDKMEHPAYFSYPSDQGVDDSFQNLSKSDYAKVIFYDLYSNTDSTVGCRFQITDHVHEDPCDYIGLFKVGYDNLTQCFASKLLSQTECEEDGKLLRCTFKPTELPELENGFYQFLYVTRDKEVCGKSMPLQIKNSVSKDLSSDEDVVADNSEDDFLVVRSNMAEKNRRLQALLDEMTEKCLTHENETRKIQQKLVMANEDKLKLEKLLKKACEEKISLFNETQKIVEEKNVVCSEKEEAIRILKEKNKVFSSMFDNYSDKLKEFTELKDALEADKNLAVAENEKLKNQLQKLTYDIQNGGKLLECEQMKYEELLSQMQKETSSLTSQLEDAKYMIEALEKSKELSMNELTSLNEKIAKFNEKLKEAKCENLVLKSRMAELVSSHEKAKDEKEANLSELTALKLHILELHESKSKHEKFGSHHKRHHLSSPKMKEKGKREDMLSARDMAVSCLQRSLAEQMQDMETKTKMQNLEIDCEKLHLELEEKNETISKLKEELVKAEGVIEYLTKERDSFQKNESLKQQALDECILRLNEASELYKKQFRKIEKLKKKLNNSNVSFSGKSSSDMSCRDSCSIADSADESLVSAIMMPQSHNSDSDTGEHVVRHPNPIKVQKKEACAVQCSSASSSRNSSLCAEAKSRPSSSKTREIPELQTLIEMNLEKLKNSKTKEEDEVLYSIPCPVCEQDIGVYMSSTDEMVKHLETQHKQQLCPVCGKLYDMTLPPKYFMFHVEDHFIQRNTK